MTNLCAWAVRHDGHGLTLDHLCYLKEGEQPDTNYNWVRVPWLDQPLHPGTVHTSVPTYYLKADLDDARLVFTFASPRLVNVCVSEQSRGWLTRGSSDITLPANAFQHAGTGTLTNTVVNALTAGELHGKAADEAVHQLFWAYFVNTTEGQKYLRRFVPRTWEHYLAYVLSTCDAFTCLWDAWREQHIDNGRYGVNALMALDYIRRRIEHDSEFADAFQCVVDTGDVESMLKFVAQHGERNEE